MPIERISSVASVCSVAQQPHGIGGCFVGGGHGHQHPAGGGNDSQGLLCHGHTEQISLIRQRAALLLAGPERQPAAVGEVISDTADVA